MNVTVADPTAAGFVQVSPTPVVKGAFSNLNPEPGRTIANLVVVPLGAGGRVDLYSELYNPGTLDLLADVVGYFTDSTAPSSTVGLFVPITPTRALDTRQPAPQPEVASGGIVDVNVNALAPGASAIAGNLTSTGGGPGGYLQLVAVTGQPRFGIEPEHLVRRADHRQRGRLAGRCWWGGAGIHVWFDAHLVGCHRLVHRLKRQRRDGAPTTRHSRHDNRLAWRAVYP